jgi:SH3-like domain-containing protein
MKVKIIIIFFLILSFGEIFAIKHEQFMSTKFYEINVRVGPGKIYPTKLIYKKKFLPLKITADYEDWKQVEDIDGDGGWVHISTLSKNRTIIINTKEKLIYRQPTEKSVLIAKALKNMVCKLKKCKDDWCKVQCADQTGWTQCGGLWGIYKNECKSFR